MAERGTRMNEDGITQESQSKLENTIAITEGYWREKIAQEIEDYRVHRCRCEQTLEKNCEDLTKAVEIAMGA